MPDSSIAIIGGGNLGGAIAEGLVASGHLPPTNVVVTRRRTERLTHLADRGMTVTADNRAAISACDTVIVCVEPHHVPAVLAELRPGLSADRHLLISCATGVSLADMGAMAGDDVRRIRAMPNTAVSVREAFTCLATQNADEDARSHATALFGALGRAVFVEEELMGAATVLAACGVAFSLRFIRAAAQGGIEIGFDAETARLIAAQTVLGAARLLLARDAHPEAEIDRVTTPKGCTIAGLNEMEHRGFSSALIKGITTSHDKIARIAHEMDAARHAGG